MSDEENQAVNLPVTEVKVPGRETPYTMKEAVDIIADAAALNGRQILIVGARQSWIGDVLTVSDTCILLVNARIAQSTGDLSSDKVSICQQPPTGIIAVALSAIEAVVVGKPEPKQ